MMTMTREKEIDEKREVGRPISSLAWKRERARTAPPYWTGSPQSTNLSRIHFSVTRASIAGPFTFDPRSVRRRSVIRGIDCGIGGPSARPHSDDVANTRGTRTRKHVAFPWLHPIWHSRGSIWSADARQSARNEKSRVLQGGTRRRRRRCRARRRNRLAIPARNGARGTAWRAYERLLRTVARSVTADTIRRLYLLVRHVQLACPPAYLPTCLYLRSSPLLPPSPPSPHRDIVRVHLEHLPGERRTRTSLPGIGR